jgi:hypothetical protein
MEEAFVKNYPNFKNYFEQVKKAYVGMIRGLFDKTVYYKIRKNRVPPGVMSPDEISMMNSIWYNHIRDKQKAFELQEKEKNTNSAGPATNAANATSTTINGVTMVPVVPEATRQTNDGEKQGSTNNNNNNNKRLTIEYVRDYIKRLPTYKLWELLNEKPEVSKLEDW